MNLEYSCMQAMCATIDFQQLKMIVEPIPMLHPIQGTQGEGLGAADECWLEWGPSDMILFLFMH